MNPPPSEHCTDLNGDRELGKLWEQKFCVLAAEHGKLFTPHQIGRELSAAAHYRKNGEKCRLILPDITIWDERGEHHEIKHKNPTNTGHYGLERYRFDSLCDFGARIDGLVYYTIHDHSRLGKHSQQNEACDWRTCEISKLLYATDNDGDVLLLESPSWVAGQQERVPCWYWPTRLFTPLVSLWTTLSA